MSETTSDRQRILIVDDSKVIRVTARKILQDHFETIEAVDGENAWDVLSGMGPFSLVISDLTMPKLDGYGLLEKIRSAHDPDINTVPVIVITGDNDSESTMQRAREAGATDFIGKPFDAVHLLARAQSHASAHAERQSLTEQNMTLEDQALVDTQTGLANEVAFMERGTEQLSFAQRHNTTLTVAQIEIDNYGELHQQHGDPVTEMVVKYVANVLESGIRQEDMAARIGPARFAMLLTGMERNGVQALTDRICRNIRERVIRYGSEKISFTVSIGICTPALAEHSDFDHLFRMAGKNLQQAIADHGNRTVFDNTPCSDSQPVQEPCTDDVSADDVLDLSHAETVTGESLADEAQDAVEAETDTVVAVLDEAVVADEAEAETVADTVPAEAARLAESPETEEEAAAATDEDHLPEMFAEPVSGVSRNLASKLNKAKKLSASPGIGKIVIEAPFSAHPVNLKQSDEHVEADNASEANSAEDAVPTSGHQEQAGDVQATELAETTDFDTETPRKGLFRRILSLFSRSGK